MRSAGRLGDVKIEKEEEEERRDRWLASLLFLFLPLTFCGYDPPSRAINFGDGRGEGGGGARKGEGRGCGRMVRNKFHGLPNDHHLRLLHVQTTVRNEPEFVPRDTTRPFYQFTFKFEFLN